MVALTALALRRHFMGVKRIAEKYDGSENTNPTPGQEFAGSVLGIVVGSMALLMTLFLIELVLVVYSFMVIFRCFKGETGMQVLLVLVALFVPFGALGISVWGLANDCKQA